MKTSKMALFIAAVMFAPSAFAYEITPYVGLGIVVDKANTSAKRVAFDSANLPVINVANPDLGAVAGAFMPNAGNDMDFDMAFAGEITAGVKIDNVRLEAEVALRSASEDDYKIFDGNIDMSMGSLPGSVNIPTEIETATKVRHNSYLFNMFYDFDLGTRWTPYVGAGIGFGVYHQKAIVEIDIEEDEFGIANAGNPILDLMGGADILAQLQQYEREMTVADDTLYRFEWQVSAGIAYNFNEDWALDLGYRFNSSTVGGEFVYAHEIKLGARYMF